MEFKREDVTRGFMIKGSVKQHIHFELFDVYKDIAMSAIKNFELIYGTELPGFVDKLAEMANKFDIDPREDMFISDKEAYEIADELDSLAKSIISELSSIKSRNAEVTDTSWANEAIDIAKQLYPISDFFERFSLY